MEQINSLQNTKIKNLVKLQKSSERKEQKRFLVEGFKEIQLAHEAGYKIEMLFWCPILGIEESKISKLNSNNNIYKISQEIFAKIAYREGSDGVMAVFYMQNILLENIKLSKKPLIIILESVEKPGNLGAVLRTADAVHADAVLICDPRTDIFNPNVIRSSIGCVFTNQVVSCTNVEALNWLKKHNIKSYAAALVKGALNYHKINYNEPTAFIMGTESDGLSDFWLQNASTRIVIPMLGKIDSLNVSVSTAVLAFEVVRQRGIEK